MHDPVLLELPESVETERLLLRPPRSGDGPALFEALTEALPELRLFLASLPWVAREPSVLASEAFCRKAQANFLARKDMPYFLFEKASGDLIGTTGLHRPEWTVPKVEIGYWVRTSRSGRGLIGEAVSALVQVAFGPLGAKRIDLVTDEDNAPSRRVAERCGFELEGIHRQERRAPDGSLRNTCIYARIAPP